MTILADIVSSFMLLGAFGTGGSTPFWATANSFGLMPESNGMMMMANAHMGFDESRKVQFRWGASVAARIDGSDIFQPIPDELYAGIRWKVLALDLGMKHTEQDYMASDSVLGSLSTTAGRLCWSGNARTVPGYTLRLEPWSIPGTKDILQLYGHWGDYCAIDTRYVEYPWVHNMQLGLKLNVWRFSLDLRIDHYAMWAGTDPKYGRMPSSFADYFRMCFGMKASSSGSLSDQINVLGDQRGAELIRLNYKGNGWKISVAHEIPYEDKSGMRFVNFPDGVNTLSFSFDRKDRWVSDVVYEFIYTMNQSGPLHERPATEEEMASQDPSHPWYGYIVLGGEDDYFNHEEYKSGWTFWGRTAGLPLMTPAGTRAGSWNRNTVTLGVENNKIIAHHVAVSGLLFRKVPYKLMLTWSQNYGVPRKHRPVETFDGDWSGYGQFCSAFTAVIPLLKGRLRIMPGIYYDYGKILTSGFGCTVGLSYTLETKWPTFHKK
ncbi:MAG: hypothetical protein J5764_05135 [Bacteroidales bacterium]|nr:hypothetical protein [Bacteroidales bacterium]